MRNEIKEANVVAKGVKEEPCIVLEVHRTPGAPRKAWRADILNSEGQVKERVPLRLLKALPVPSGTDSQLNS